MTGTGAAKPPETEISRVRRDFATQELVIQGLQKAIGELVVAYGGLTKTIGEEQIQPNGETLGTGLTGRIVRIEARDRKESTKRTQMLATIRGALLAFGVILPLIVWLTRPSLDRVFHPELAPAHAAP